MDHVSAHGARIPVLGLGTWALRGGEARRMVEHALSLGYRHLDTAQMYGNEDEVGAGLRGSGVPRAEVVITTKIWPDSFRDGDLQRAAERSVSRLGLDAVPLDLCQGRGAPEARGIGEGGRVEAGGEPRRVEGRVRPPREPRSGADRAPVGGEPRDQIEGWAGERAGGAAREG